MFADQTHDNVDHHDATKDAIKDARHQVYSICLFEVRLHLRQSGLLCSADKWLVALFKAL